MLKPEANTGVIFWSGAILKIRPGSIEISWDAIRTPARCSNGWDYGPKPPREQ